MIGAGFLNGDESTSSGRRCDESSGKSDVLCPDDSSNGGVEFGALLTESVGFEGDGVASTLGRDSDAVFKVRELLRRVKLGRVSS